MNKYNLFYIIGFSIFAILATIILYEPTKPTAPDNLLKTEQKKQQKQKAELSKQIEKALEDIKYKATGKFQWKLITVYISELQQRSQSIFQDIIKRQQPKIKMPAIAWQNVPKTLLELERKRLQVIEFLVDPPKQQDRLTPKAKQHWANLSKQIAYLEIQRQRVLADLARLTDTNTNTDLFNENR